MHSRLDYCNSVLYSLPWSRLQLLQSVLNFAARLIRGLKRFDHISPVLIELHWLPYPQRVKYKVCMLMFKCLKGLAPAYLVAFCTKGSAVSGRWLWDPLCAGILLCLATGRIGVWEPLLLLVPAVGMSFLLNWGTWRLVQRLLRNTWRRYLLTACARSAECAHVVSLQQFDQLICILDKLLGLYMLYVYVTVNL